MNEGALAMWRTKWSDGYTIGASVLAELAFSVDLGNELRRRPRRDRAFRRCRDRQLCHLGYGDLGGEG